MSIFVVLGAKGGTGAEIVRRLTELSASQCREIRAVVRDPSSVASGLFGIPSELDGRIKIIKGDCTQPASLTEPFKGAHAVFFAAAGKGYANTIAVDQDGVGSTATASLAEGGGDIKKAPRVVLVSSQLVAPKNRWNLIRGILNSINSGLFHSEGMMDFKYRGEELLRHSGAPFTIVRPGRLMDGEMGATGKVCIGQCDASFLQGGGTTRADVAAVCVSAALAPGALNTTFEVAGSPKEPSDHTTALRGKEGGESGAETAMWFKDTFFAGLAPRFGDGAV